MSLTSAGIFSRDSFGFPGDAALARALEKRATLRSAARAIVATTVLALGGCAIALVGVVVVETDAVARCIDERDDSGHGLRAALRALEDPVRQSRFLYRVSRDDERGYRAVVVVKAGPFAGDAWERDGHGRVRHISDSCRDNADARWAGLF